MNEPGFRARPGRWGMWVALAVLVVTVGCATRGDVDYLAEQHQRIEERQSGLEARVASLESTMNEMRRLLREIRADFKADLGAVRTGLSALESALRGTESRIEQLRRRPVPVRPETQPGDTTSASEVDPIALYNAAITDYQQGRLDLAARGFEEYLRVFPRGPSASDARYWLGIIDYDRGDYQAAIEILGEVPRRWPDSAKAPLALRKIGDAYRALGETARARAAYTELIERYPNSSEAADVRREMAGR